MPSSLYAQPGDLANVGLSALALQGVPSPQVYAALAAGSAIADSFIGQKFVLPVLWTGAWGPVVFSGTGPATAVSFGSVPNNPLPWVVKIALGGIVGVATFQVAQDGGTNFGPATLTAATVQVTINGTTLQIPISFAAGTYVLGDTYTFDPMMVSQGWGMDLTVATAQVASLILLNSVGYNPKLGNDEAIRDADVSGRKWLELVAKGFAHPTGPGPDGIVDSNPTPPVNSSTPQLQSPAPFNYFIGNKTRGWRPF